MELQIKYITKIISPPKSGKEINFWVPLAQTDVEQAITLLSIESPLGFKINEEEVFGNKMVYISSARFEAGDKITLSYRLKRKTTSTIVDKNEDIRKHLVLTRREQWDKHITEFTDQVVGSETEPLEIGRKIYYALIDRLTYDKAIPGCGFGNSSWTLENNAGRCDDFHALFRTMMIYKQVPVRWEQGIPLPYPSALTESGKIEGDCTGAHCWVRFYIGEGRWVPVDVSEADKREDLRDYFFGTISANRFKVSTGRDLILNRPQEGEPLNTFPFTYGESNGIPLIYGHNFKNEILYKVLHIEV
jgi:transglutaminase-like putative cysteine protease